MARELDDLPYARYLTALDLRGATALDVADGLDSLRGATISSPQLMDLAPAFARSIGITVRD
ncbi:hypothetical protein [Nocardia sp. NPDC004750]